MPWLQHKSLAEPDSVRAFPNGTLRTVSLCEFVLESEDGFVALRRGTFTGPFVPLRGTRP